MKRPVLAACLLGCLCVTHLRAQEPSRSEHAPSAARQDSALEMDHVSYRISGSGTLSGFFQKDGANLLSPPTGVPLMLVRVGKTWHPSTSCRVTKDGQKALLRIAFAGAKVEAQATARCHAQYIEVEATALEGEGRDAVEEWVFVNLPVAIRANVGGWLNVAWDESFAVAVIALDEQTKAWGAPILRASGIRRLDLLGRKAAIIACPTGQLLDVVQEIEKAHGLPCPMLGGQWAKRSMEARKSWMITGLTAADEPAPYRADRVFGVAKDLGIEYIVICLNWWNTTLGSYAINTKNFPQGVASLKNVADKAHQQGLKLGIHVMTCSITKNDPYVSPLPDPRLQKEGSVTLAAQVDAAAKEIPTVESAASFGSASGYWAYRGTDVQIDDEIIRYTGIQDTAPFVLTGCTRGAYGTRAAPHEAGAKIYHLRERFGWYVANEELADEIGRKLAGLIDEVGLDMVCFDGADVSNSADPEIHHSFGHRVAGSLLSNVHRDVLLFSNGSTHYGWHLMARGGEEDAMARGYQRWVDDRTAQGWAGYHAQNLMPPDLSWVGIFGHTATLTATRPDDVELVCARSLGLDAAIGWGFAACFGGPSTVATFAQNGRRDEIARLIRTYEKLRLEGHFPEEIRRPLRQWNTYWNLVPPDQGGGPYRIAPARYHKSQIIRAAVPETAVLSFQNDLGEVPLRLRLEALQALAPYGSSGNVVVADFGSLEFEAKGHPASNLRVERHSEVHPQAGATLHMTCTGPAPNSGFPVKLTGHGETAWAQATAKFPAPLDLSRHRGLGAWIYGDGGGEVLNVQMEIGPGSYLHFYQPIDFSGWRYCELGEPEGDRVMDYFTYEKFALHDVPLDRFNGVTLMILDPPRGKPVDIRIGRIEALQERGGELVHPRITLGGQTTELPVRLQPQQYLETGDLWGTRDPAVYRVFDADGNTLAQGRLSKTPIVPQGRVEITLTASGEPRARGRLTAILVGSD